MTSSGEGVSASAAAASASIDAWEVRGWFESCAPPNCPSPVWLPGDDGVASLRLMRVAGVCVFVSITPDSDSGGTPAAGACDSSILRAASRMAARRRWFRSPSVARTNVATSSTGTPAYAEKMTNSSSVSSSAAVAWRLSGSFWSALRMVRSSSTGMVGALTRGGITGRVMMLRIVLMSLSSRKGCVPVASR